MIIISPNNDSLVINLNHSLNSSSSSKKYSITFMLDYLYSKLHNFFCLVLIKI
nr:MAG TPA: hypothetical protein [Caudoviricetes sp.]